MVNIPTIIYVGMVTKAEVRKQRLDASEGCGKQRLDVRG